MQKRLLTLLISVLALGVLIGAYFLVTKLDMGSADETTSAPVLSYSVAEIDRSTLYAMGFTYNGESFDLTLKEDATGWTLKGKESLPISNIAVASIVQHFEKMTSDFKIESPSEEKQKEYGFEKPSASVYFYDVNGRHEYIIGTQNTFNSMYYLTSSHDKTNVYLVAGEFMADLALEETDLIEVKQFASVSLDHEISLEFQNEDNHLVYKYYPDGKSGYLIKNSKWFLSINGGVEFPINEKTDTLLSEACKYFGFAECISYAEEDVEKYGLSNAVKLKIDYTSVTVTTDSETGTETSTESKESSAFLLGSKDENGFSYAKIESSPLIYITVSDVYDTVMNVNADKISEICTKYAVYADTSELSEVKITLGSELHTLNVTEEAGGVKYTINGKEIKKVDAETLLAAVSSIPFSATPESVPTLPKNSYLTLTLSTESKSTTASFTTFSDKFYGVTLDYTDALYVEAKYVNTISSLLEDILK